MTDKGWILPTPVDGYDLVCVSLKIPNNDYYIGAFRGAIKQLENWWNWEKSGVPGDTRATEAARYWRGLINEHLAYEECQPVVTQNCGMPVGTIFASVRYEIPGCLVCDGSSYLKEEYPELYDAMPGTMKTGIGFTVPDLLGRTIVGDSISDPPPANYPAGAPALDIGDAGGEWEHTLSVSELPAHKHAIYSTGDTGTSSFKFILTRSTGNFGGYNLKAAGVGDNEAYIQNTGGGEDHNNAQPYQAFRYHIVAQSECGDQHMAEQLRFRQNPAANCQLQYSINEGATWSLAFDYSKCTPMELNQILSNQYEAENLLRRLLELYDGQPGSVAPDSVYDSSVNDAYRDAAQCYALRVLVSTTLEALAANSDNLTRAGIFSAALVALGGAAAFFTGGISLLVAAGIAGALVLSGSAILENISDTELRNQEAWEEIICCAMTNLRGNTPTQNLFQAAFTGCSGLSATAEKQRAAMNTIVQNLDVYLSYLSMVQEGFTLAQNGLIVDDCCNPCDPISFVVNSNGSIATLNIPSGYSIVRWSGTVKLSVVANLFADGVYGQASGGAWASDRGYIQYRLQGTSTWNRFTPIPTRSTTGYTFPVPGTGTYEFRLFDTNYADNSGTFTLFLDC